MTKSKVLAWILLSFVLAALIYSVVCLFMGRLDQAMLFTPMLIVLYVFGVGTKKISRHGQTPEKDPDSDPTTPPSNSDHGSKSE